MPSVSENYFPKNNPYAYQNQQEVYTPSGVDAAT